MSYANMFELKSCLKDAIAYCEAHAERVHSQTYTELLTKAYADLLSAVEVSNKHFTSWRVEDREDKMAWKNLAKELRETQIELARVGAVGYFDQRILYWDTDLLAAAVKEMLEYLEDRKDDLDFAQKKIDVLQRQTSQALNEDFESGQKLKQYLRFAQVRSDAMKNAINTISGFRRVLRKDLGKGSEEYLALRWPIAVASDEALI